jgi:hypothetical protein
MTKQRRFLAIGVYTGQQWENLHESHAQDIIVHYPDGHDTKGIPDHVKELKFMWTFAPDNRQVISDAL